MLRRIAQELSLVGALLCALLVLCGQSPIAGFPPGVFTSRAALDGGSAASVMTTPIIGFSQNNAPSNSAANYAPLLGEQVAYNATAFIKDMPIPIGGTFSNFYVNFVTTLSTGQYVVAMTHNGSWNGTLNCAITTSAGHCLDSTAGDNITVSPGDTVGIVVCPGTASSGACTPTGTPTTSAVTQTASTFVSTNVNEGFLGGATNAQPSTSVEQWAPINGGGIWFSTNDAIVAEPMAAAGNIDHLYVVGGTAPGAAKTYTLVVYQNGSPTSLLCTLSGTGSGAGITTCNDTSDALTISLGDTLSVASCPGTVAVGSCTPVPTPASDNIRWGVRWVPTTAGQSLIEMADVVTMPGTSGSTNLSLNGGSTSGGTLANFQQIAGSSFTIKNLYALVSTAPGSGTPSRTATVAVGGSASSTACTMTTATSCTSAVTTSVSQGNLLGVTAAAASTPAAITSFKLGAVMTVP